jgi:hypothetical protein
MAECAVVALEIQMRKVRSATIMLSSLLTFLALTYINLVSVTTYLGLKLKCSINESWFCILTLLLRRVLVV